MSRRVICAIAYPLFGVALISMPSLGHHGTGGTYLMDKPPITLKGTVTEFRFVNPHVLVFFNVTGEKSTIVNWRADGPALINWTRAGWNRNSLKVGDQIVMTLFPSRAGKPEGVLARLVAPNGKEWCCQSRNGYPEVGVPVQTFALPNEDSFRRAVLSASGGTAP